MTITTTSYEPFRPSYIPAYPPLSWSPASPSFTELESPDWLSARRSSGVQSGASDRKLLSGSSVQEVKGRLPGRLSRQLKARHISMISIGGVIGTGLFLGTAQSLQKGGPAGLLLGYGIMGLIVCAMMLGLGEMISALPLPGGHITLARRFVNEVFSISLGWLYYYDWALCLPAELNAAAVLISYWNSNINPAVFIAVCFLAVILINVCGTRAYGETEFWFAGIKIVTIIGLIILGIVIDVGGGPTREFIGARYWRLPGPWVQYLGIEGALGRFTGFYAVMSQAAFSYSGTEIVAIAAAEARNPKLSLPRAVRVVWIRVLLFYVASTAVIGLIVASNDPRLGRQDGTAMSSPFVVAIRNSGIRGLHHLINAAILTSALSAASSNLYTSSRTIFGMALNGQAPAYLAKTSSWGLPWVSLSVSIVIGLLSFMSAGTADAATVFGWLVQMASSSVLCTWSGISIIYLRFYYGARAQGISRTLFPTSPCGEIQLLADPFAPPRPALEQACLVLVVTQGFEVFLPGQWSTATFVTTYVPIAVFGAIYVVAAWRYGRGLVPLEEMDFFSGSRDADEEISATGKTFGLLTRAMRSVF